MYTLPTSLPYIDLLPGPFLLLIFIPLLPLALFSLGARPPTGSSFDFLTDELWRTTALLGVAVTVGLCVGVYPESIKGMGGWLMDGNLNWGNYLKVGPGAKGGGAVNGAVPIGRTVIKRAKPSFDRIARNHITALRYYYPRQYNPSNPKPASVLILGIMIILFTIVITGKILQGVYESDSSSSSTTKTRSSPSTSSKPSAWVTHEYETRKKEAGKPDVTMARYKKEEAALSKKYEGKKKDMGKEDYEKYIKGKCKERKKDLEMLSKMLKNKALEPVGLDKIPGWYVPPVVDDKDKDKGKDGGSPKEVEVIKETKTVKVKSKTKVTGEETMGDKIRNALLGKTLANARKKDKAVVKGSVSPAAAAPVAARGPGWEVADPTSGVVLAQSAGNAEALARGMGR